MSTARRCAVCVFLFTFSFVVLCVTGVCGEYSAGVSREGNVDARGPKYIYAAGGKRWQMRAILQSELKVKEGLSDPEVSQDNSKNFLSTDGQAKAAVTTEGRDTVGVEASSARGDDEHAPDSPVVVNEPGKVGLENGREQPVDGALGQEPLKVAQTKSDDKSSGDPSSDQNKGKQTIPEQAERKPTDDASSPPAAPDPSIKQTASGGGGGDASQTEIKHKNAGGQGDKNGQSTPQPAGTGETKKEEGTTTFPTSQEASENNTETTDFAALVRAPLVFFLLLAALACVCVC